MEKERVLKDCPFCGNTDVKFVPIWDRYVGKHLKISEWCVGCDKCGASVHFMNKEMDIAEVAESYNNRSKPIEKYRGITRIGNDSDREYVAGIIEKDDWTLFSAVSKEPMHNQIVYLMFRDSCYGITITKVRCVYECSRICYIGVLGNYKGNRMTDLIAWRADKLEFYEEGHEYFL